MIRSAITAALALVVLSLSLKSSAKDYRRKPGGLWSANIAAQTMISGRLGDWIIIDLPYLDSSSIDNSDSRKWYSLKSMMDDSRKIERPRPTSIGDLVSRREAPPPMTEGVVIRLENLFGFDRAVADEWTDPQFTDYGGNGEVPSSGFFGVGFEPGYRFETSGGYLEIGLPMAFFVTQLKVSIGVSALWRFKKAPALGLGFAASFLPKKYLMLEALRVVLTYRPVRSFEFYVKPIGILFIVEPARDVWVEDGFESKVPYWGMIFSIGCGWTIQAR